MKQNKLFLGLATMFAAAFTFSACSSDDAESQSVQQDRTIRLTSSVERGSTRAISDPQGSTLSTSSSLGVFAINSTTVLTNGDNEPYSVDGSGNLNPTTATNTMAWPASGNVSFYAYAPRINGATYYSANSFSVQTDQTTEANYLASDLVLAKNEDVAETSSAVELSFNHLMAKINITIQKATNATVDLKHAKVSIINTNTATTFKPNATGTGDDKVLGTSSTPADITLFSGDGTAEPSTVVGIMVPQTIAAGSGLVKIQTYPGNVANRTLIAKIDEAKKFESGEQYSFTVTINDPTAPITYITLKAGSTQLVAWENNALGASTKEFSLGDYILSDGSLLKANDPDFATKKTNIIAVIFSNQVSSTDAEAGYDAYAMGVSRIGAGGGTKKQWYVNTSYNLGAANLADGFADLDGRTKCATIKASDTYTNLGTKTEHIANLDNYSLAIDAGAIVGSETEGNRNLSGWFTPSFGQLIAILNNLGEAGITSSIAKEFKNNSSFYKNSDNTTWANTEQGGITISTVLDKINAYTTAVGKGNILASGDVDLGTVTENTSESANGQKFWMFALKNSGDWELTAAQAKVSQSSGVKEVCVIPVVAVKLPPVAE